MSTKEYILPSAIGDYVESNTSGRYFKFREGMKSDGERCTSAYAKMNDRDWRKAFKPLDPLLSVEGKSFEKNVEDHLREEVFSNSDVNVVGEDEWRELDDSTGVEENKERSKSNVEKLRKHVEDVDSGAESVQMMAQVPLAGEIEEFFVPGYADLVFCYREVDSAGNDQTIVHVIDIKSSWKDKTYHQIQTSVYAMLLEDALDPSVVIRTGIINKDNYDSIENVNDVPVFDPEALKKDITTLLSKNGQLYRDYHKNLEDIEYSLDASTKSYYEVDLVDSLEESSLRLLGLTVGEQRAIRDEFGGEGESDLDVIKKLSRIAEDIDNPKPYDNERVNIKEEYKTEVNKLVEKHGITKDMSLISLKARKMLSVLEPGYAYAHDKDRPMWIQNAPDSVLPDDNPIYEDEGIDRGEMVRVYLSVQKDSVTDTIFSIAGRVTSTKTEAYYEKRINESDDKDEAKKNYHDSVTCSVSMDEIELLDKEGNKERETKLLSQFIKELYGKIKFVSEHIHKNENANLHFYVYSNSEKQELEESLEDSYKDSKLCESFYNLISCRERTEQKMFSVVEEDIENRIITKNIVKGLLPISEELPCFDGDGYKNKLPEYNGKVRVDDWTYERETGETVDLREAFYQDMFDHSVICKVAGRGVEIDYSGNRGPNDFYYTVTNAHYTSIHPSYLWGCKEVDQLNEGWVKEYASEDIAPRMLGIAKNYMWIDTEMEGLGEEYRIHIEDIEAMTRKLAQLLNQVERGLDYKNGDIEKESINVNSLPDFRINSEDIYDSLRDYMDIEHEAGKKEAVDQYRLPIESRVLSGRSVPVKIEDIDISEKPVMKITCKTAYEDLDLNDPRLAAMSSRVGKIEEGERGAWMVASPMVKEDGSFVEDVDNIEKIYNSPPVTVTKFDPTGGEAVLEHYMYSSGNKRYSEWHKQFNGDDVRFSFNIEEGDYLILDERIDNMSSDRILQSIKERNGNNGIIPAIERALNSKNTINIGNSYFNKNEIEKFLEELEDTDLEFTPNDRQSALIKNTDSIVSLQGPPGTGKTSGSLAFDIISKIVSSSREDSNCRVLVTGPSNRSIDEAMEHVNDLLVKLEDDFPELRETRLYRMCNFDGDLSKVTYTSHKEEDKMVEMGNRLKDTAQTTVDGGIKNTVVFSTPTTIFNLNKLVDDSLEHEGIYDLAPSLFDSIVIDEASMMPLPYVSLFDCFMEGDGQFVIAGDHRQMSPVQQHEWEDERRVNMREYVPFLSILDYTRFLKGEEVGRIEDVNIETRMRWDVEMIRLKETYRCHEDIARMLKEWIYKKDGIEYTSNRDHVISEVESENWRGKKILEPDSPLTLISHNDTTNQQTSLTEAKIVSEIVDNIPEDESVGIVTPHNAQKGLIKSLCDGNPQVDTVERYQGGQKDIMIISATVSDYDYIRKESEFILSPNRLNVSLSRMKKKLIVVAPQSLFNIIPRKTREYENAALWKYLYSEVDGHDEADEEFNYNDWFEGERDIDFQVHLSE